MDFVIFDVETTGLSPQNGDRIIELAALKVRDLKEVDRFESFVDPKRPISPGAFLVNGITQQMLQGAPSSEQVLPELMEFIGDACLVGHNIKFDLRFLNNELELAGLSAADHLRVMDTVRMARGLMPELGRYSLANVAYQLGIDDPQEHRAMSDVVMTFKVFNRLIEQAHNKGIIEMDRLIDLFGNKPYDQQKHKIKLDQLSDAIETKSQLKLLYVGANSGALIRTVTPQKVLGRGRSAILIGYCHLREDERNFKVERIAHIEELIIQ